jgi:hypothetical protein
MNRSLWQPPRPIAQAPIDKDHGYGPCLLSPGINGNAWVVGEWDGEDWWTLDGETRLEPSHYALLPARSSLDC